MQYHTYSRQQHLSPHYSSNNIHHSLPLQQPASTTEGVERVVRKKPKLESKILNISAASDAARGPRDSMEDTHTVRDDLKFYGVYDGHGGEQAAKLLQNLLHTNIVNSQHYTNGNIEEAINEAFAMVDKEILKESQEQKWDSGTTAVVALIKDKKLYIANCGDSEAVLGRRKQKKQNKSKDNKAQPKPRPTTPLSCAISEEECCQLSSSLSDSMGSPTAVLSHLSLASPRKIVPRFRSRNNSISSETLSDIYNSAPSSVASTPTTPPPSFQPNTKSLIPNIPNDKPTNHNTNEDNNNESNQTNNATDNNKQGEQEAPQADRTMHKRSHSPPKDTEENGGDDNDCECEEDDDDEYDDDEFEFEEAGPSLSDNIEAYLKDNPNSFFCQTEGKCGVFEPVVLSHCHRPSCEEEVQRISDAGGAVSYGRVSGELAVTRSFGDINYKHPHNKGKGDFVCVQPHIRVIDLQPSDEFLILASDGLWDVLSHKDAVDLVSKMRSAGDSRQACEDLVDEALRKNSFDNVTVVFLSFKWTNAA